VPDEFPAPADKRFPGDYPKRCNRILDKNDLKLDRDDNPRTADNLYICLRLMDRADIDQITKNCRTSVETIKKFYAAPIKNTLDATAINVMRPRGAKGGKAPANGGAKDVAGKVPTVKLTAAENLVRNDRARLAARTPPDDPSDTDV
jgi:hypothetical protein